jgi:hypothetical protein
MTDENNNIPVDGSDDYEDNFIESGDAGQPAAATPPQEASPRPNVPPPAADDRMDERLERLGGEPAPVITPEEFARLQRSGQVNIDARGRVRTARRASEANEGVSLRKRRAWYGC